MMYEAHYGFTEKPFSLLPDPGFLYLSRRHGMAFAMLQYGVTHQAGFTVIAGEVGSGKTTLIRHLLNEVPGHLTVGLISNAHSSFGELLQWVSLAFNLPYQNKEKVELYAQFQEFMIGEYQAGRSTVLIIDEAQNLSVETLEELRMLSNINADKDHLLQLVLVGQPELRDTLRRPELRQFAQRISVAYYLKDLDERETTDYIRHRLRTAGGREDLFDDAAIRAVHRFSRGVPRLINNLCDLALVYGFALERDTITADVVEEVARDKADSGLFEDSAPAAPPLEDEAPPADQGTQPLHRIR